jgi:hypothetical protein
MSRQFKITLQEKLQREFEDMKYSGEAKLSRYKIKIVKVY